MAFTKINAAGIGSTETVTVDGLTVINNGSFGGNLSVAGVLTYEDVTNVDSVGLITARAGVVVGSGITLSKDGDIFATGITTVSGNVKVGTGITLSPDGDIFATGITTVGKSVFLSGNNPNIRLDDSDTTNNGEITLDNTQLRIEVDEDDSTSSSAIKFRVDGSDQITIDSSGDLTIKDKIIHSGDTNTAIRFPAADKVTVETSGTERLAIEPAGNVNVPKSVNVGTGLTVGAAGSTSVFLGQGHIELTRDAGNAFIDFKDAFADDYDARIIADSNQLQFFTGGNGSTVTALVTGTGKVGISTNTLPTVAKLEVHSDKLGGTAGNTQELLYLKSPDISNSTTYRFTTYRHTNGTSHSQSEGRLRRHVDATDMAFFGLGDGYANIGYGTAEKARITSDGKFGLGLTSPTGKFAVSDGTVIGEINPYSSSSTCFIGTRSNHSVTLKTNASGRLTITTSGDLYVNTSSKINAGLVSVAFNGGTHCAYALKSTNAGGADLFRFFNSGGTQIGSITHNNSNTSFTTSSDYRLKENISAISDGITRLKTLKPSRFNFKSSPSTTVDGFIAHEVTAVPEAIKGTKDEVDSDNNPVYQGIDQSKLVPLLTAALQEAITKIETLEAEVAALKG